MITTNQNSALMKAHAQPSASTRPPSARRLTGVRGAGSAVWAMSVPHDERARHVRMHGADEGVVALLERRDLVRPRRDAREDLADEDVAATCVLDCDVLPDAGVLVLEHEVERLGLRRRQVLDLERQVDRAL